MSLIVPNARGKPGVSGPFCWQSIFVLRHIRDVAEGSERVSVSATLATYLALTEAASNARSSTVPISIGEVGRLAGLGRSTTTKALSILGDAGFLIATCNYIGTGGLKASNSYTLLRHERAMCKFCTSQATSEKPVQLTVLGEEAEEKEEGPPPQLPQEWIDRAERDFPRRADLRRIAAKFVTHYGAQRQMISYERFADWIRSERCPDVRIPTKECSVEPEGWRELYRARYPKDACPDLYQLTEKQWKEICQYDRKNVYNELQRNHG